MTSNNDKLRITADIIIAVVSNSTKDTYDRLNAVPEAFEKIYNKIDELDKRSIPNTTIDDVDGFDILEIDEPPEEYEYELDEPVLKVSE